MSDPGARARSARAYPVERLAEWARGRPDVLALVVIGSQARAEVPADDLSDLDLLVVVEEVKAFTEHDEWLDELGDYLIASLEQSGDFYFEREILYRNGEKLDLIFVPASHLGRWPETGLEPGMAAVVNRGAKIIQATDEVRALVEKAAVAPPALPTEREFSVTVATFLVDCASGTRKLSRGEVWVVRDFVEAWLRPEVVRMLEVRARARGEESWPSGRFMDRWVEPDTLRALESITIARVEASEVHGALVAMLDLFLQVANDVAASLGYAWPADEAAEVSKWVADLRPAT